jgi:alpha-beta hydrolase superfamily lysophospholipase
MSTISGSPPRPTTFGSRAQVTTFLEKIADATGNKDGVLGNEGSPANTVAGGVFDKNPILFSLKQHLAAGWSKADENEKLAGFLAATEKTFGAPVTTLPKPAHVKDEAWNAFQLDKAIALVRFDRTPGEVSDHVVKASGSVDGHAIAARDLFVQRFAPQGPPDGRGASGKTIVVSPGFLETGRNYHEQADLLTRQGHAVVVLDHQWAGLSEGDKGGIDRGFGIARDVAAVTAWAHAQSPGDQIVLLGTSMGGGAGATGAALMNDQGLVKLEGPPMPKGVDVILQDPFFARTKTLPNLALAAVGSVPLLRDLPLPAMGLPILSGDQATLRKLAAHATTEQLSGRGQAFHASTDDLARMKALLGEGKRPEGRFFVLHADDDTLADYATTREWVGLLGKNAVLQTIHSDSHVIEENPAERGLVLDGLAWLDEQKAQAKASA